MKIYTKTQWRIVASTVLAGAALFVASSCGRLSNGPLAVDSAATSKSTNTAPQKVEIPASASLSQDQKVALGLTSSNPAQLMSMDWKMVCSSPSGASPGQTSGSLFPAPDQTNGLLKGVAYFYHGDSNCKFSITAINIIMPNQEFVSKLTNATPGQVILGAGTLTDPQTFANGASIVKLKSNGSVFPDGAPESSYAIKLLAVIQTTEGSGQSVSSNASAVSIATSSTGGVGLLSVPLDLIGVSSTANSSYASPKLEFSFKCTASNASGTDCGYTATGTPLALADYKIAIIKNAAVADGSATGVLGKANFSLEGDALVTSLDTAMTAPILSGSSAFTAFDQPSSENSTFSYADGDIIYVVVKVTSSSQDSYKYFRLVINK